MAKELKESTLSFGLLFLGLFLITCKLFYFSAEGILFGFGDNKMSQLGQGHQKPIMPKPVQVQDTNLI